MEINVILAIMVIISFLIAVVFHECAHAVAASALGDSTPRVQGRQSLSLRAHLDPLGTLLGVILAFLPFLLAGPIALGWGKPVKTDPWKLRFGPNGGTLLVSLAGIVASLVLGFLVAFLMGFLPAVLAMNAITIRILQFITVFAAVNITMGLLNLVPLYPLDGYQILYTLLPSRQALKFAKSAQYGPIIIIFILFFLPFLGQLTRLDQLFPPLFELPYFIALWALDLAGLVAGHFGPVITYLYRF